jgi:MoaA/NifB/PqqE/SkfB family radical SAM enzyme
MNYLGLATRLPQYWVARALHTKHVPLPISWTFGLTYHCQANCVTCNIKSRNPVEEMTPQEWKSLFEHIGDSVFWATFSGGEPFLYNDIVPVYHYLNEICRPAAVNIPTNGQLTDRIVNKVRAMTRMFPRTQLTINVSIDHCDPDKNDEIRGLPGYYKRATETVRQLLALALTLEHRKSNISLKIGIHSVVSKYNVNDIMNIRANLIKLLKSPDDYVTEIAENRVELRTVDRPISPDPYQYRNVALQLAQDGHGLKQAFRKQYYENIAGMLTQYRYPVPPCYAGYASCQVTPEGDVWPCCILGQTVGNLRDAQFDISKIWNGDKAWLAREQARSCSCPMANVAYTNALLHPPTMAKILKSITPIGGNKK